MQDVYTFAGTSVSCQSMAHIAVYVNLYTRIRPRVTSCVTLLGTLLEHLIISKPLDRSDSYMV